MRVLFLSPGLGIGGSERLTLKYASAMLARGHATGIAHGVERGVDNDLVQVARDRGLETMQVSAEPLGLGSLPAWTRALRRASGRFRPDVLHAQSVTSAVAGRLALPRVPLLVTLHGLERADRERLAAVVLSGLGASLTAVSDRAAANVARYWPQPSIDVLPTGIDLDELERLAESVAVERVGNPAFCCVARQEPVKGVDVLIEAFARVVGKLPDAGLTLVGSGSAFESNRALADRLGLSESVRFTGTVATAEPYIVVSDVAVLPSRREGLPVAALEALGLGRPVVAAAVGGTPTVVRDGETGWLVPPEDPEALGEALVEAGGSLDEARRRGGAGQALLRRDYPPEAVFDRLEALLEQATGSDDHGSDVPPLKPRPYYVATRAYQRTRLLAARGGVPRWTGLRILGYHRVTEEDDVLAVTPQQFREHLEVLLAADVTPVSLDSGLDLLADEPSGRYVSITFDDGFRDTATHATPLLEEHGLTATVYLPTAVIDGEAAYSWYRGEPPPALTWEEVAALAQTGVLEFGAHSRTHPALPSLPHAEAADEIGRPKQEIEAKTGRPVTSFCYPAGLYTDREVELVLATGYRASVTTRAGVNCADAARAELRRTMIGWRDGCGPFQAKLEGRLDRPAAISEWLQRRRADTGQR